MKKFFYYFLYIIIVINIFASNINASDYDIVKFNKCIDGDTASFILDEEIIKVRFLAIDTPESVHPKKEVDPIGILASNYTCEKLKNAKEIKLEYDPGSNKKDKYSRLLAWIWVDNSLLQEELIKLGYAKVYYIYGNYKYTTQLYEIEEKAKKDKLGIWENPLIYTVDFYSDEKLLKTEKVTLNDKANYFIPVKKGYRFISWNYNNIVFNFDTRIDKDMKLEATFEREISIYEIFIYIIIIYIIQKLGIKRIKLKK